MERGSTSFRNPDCVASNLLFYIPYASTLVLYLVLYRTLFPLPFDAEAVFDVCQIASVAMLAAREALFCRWNRRTLALFAIVCLVCVNGYLAHWTALAGTCLFAFCARNLDMKRLMAVSCALVAVVMTITIACSLAGIIPRIDTMRYEEGSPFARYSLGFRHPNTVGILTFGIISALMVVKEESIRMRHLVAMFALTLVVFAATLSRTMVMCCMLLLVLAPIAIKLPRRFVKSKLLMWAVTLFVPVLAMTSLALIACFDPDVKWMQTVDALLSSRLSLAHTAFRHCGIAVWGHPISLPTVELWMMEGDAFVWKEAPIPVDCFYAAAVLHSGIVPTAAFVLLYSLACMDTLRTSRIATTAVLLTIAIYAVCENGAMHFYYIPAVMCLAPLFQAGSGKRDSRQPVAADDAETSFPR